MVKCMGEIKIKTLTPLWTGDVDRECKSIKETGIIGSLRWWYEALVRGLGGYACDPTNSTCEGKNHCDACELFGCTGWGRRFRLEIEGLSPVPLNFINLKSMSTLDWWINRTLGKNPNSLYGEAKLEIIPLRDGTNTENVLAFLLKTVSIVGGMGAKTQNGFGIFEIASELEETKIEEGYEIFQNSIKKLNSSSNLPNFNNFFKFDVEIRDIREFSKKWTKEIKDSYTLTGFALKYLLRTEFKKINEPPIINLSDIRKRCNQVRGGVKRKYTPSKVVARYLFGSDLESDFKAEVWSKWASRINVSHIFKSNSDFFFKIWGEIPQSLNYDPNIGEVMFNREKVINHIRGILENYFGTDVLDFEEVKFGKELIKEVLK